MKRHLVIVDLQHDFIRGSMAVQGAEAIVPRIAEMIPGCRRVTFTLDWHPSDHCSFVDRGGMWPSHCVAYTVGAGIPSEVVSAAARNASHCSFVLKGRDAGREEYGAFSLAAALRRYVRRRRLRRGAVRRVVRRLLRRPEHTQLRPLRRRQAPCRSLYGRHMLDRRRHDAARYDRRVGADGL